MPWTHKAIKKEKRMQPQSIMKVKVIRNCAFYLSFYFLLKSLMQIYWLRQFSTTTANYVFMVILHTLCVQVIKIEQHIDPKKLANSQRILYAGVIFLVGSEIARYAIDLICL